jgi:acylphosphatase
VVVARRFLISGRVQGVGYRFFTLEAGAREGLGGFVRNLEDGRVEAQAEGEQAGLDRFERALYQGPAWSRVERVEVEDLIPTGRWRTFRIDNT